MKRLMVVVAALLTQSCSGVLAFDIERDIPERRVMGSPVGGVLQDLLGAEIPMNVDLQEETAARDTGPVSGVFLNELSFSITDTAKSGADDEDDFDFLDAIEIYVASTKVGSSLERVLIAELDPVPADAAILELETIEVDIKAHVEEGASIESQARGSLPSDDVTFDGKVAITIDVL